jgi:hypothetical protein
MLTPVRPAPIFVGGGLTTYARIEESQLKNISSNQIRGELKGIYGDKPWSQEVILQRCSVSKVTFDR